MKRHSTTNITTAAETKNNQKNPNHMCRNIPYPSTATSPCHWNGNDDNKYTSETNADKENSEYEDSAMQRPNA